MDGIKMRSLVVTVLLLGIAGLIIVMHKYIGDQVEEVVQGRGDIVRFGKEEKSPEGREAAASRYRRRGENILREDRLSVGRDYVESIFYLEAKEIARQRISGDGVIETTGELPSGKVRFVDLSRDKYGVEYYTDGEKDGPSSTYYSGGRLYGEAYYRRGKLLWKKEYYEDGGLRMEIDYRDARDRSGEVETGVGKLYFRDGRIKYEWQSTNSDAEGFQKSYDRYGNLRSALFYDENGRLIE